jgi:hypothetical protein
MVRAAAFLAEQKLCIERLVQHGFMHPRDAQAFWLESVDAAQALREKREGELRRMGSDPGSEHINFKLVDVFHFEDAEQAKREGISAWDVAQKQGEGRIVAMLDEQVARYGHTQPTPERTRAEEITE